MELTFDARHGYAIHVKADNVHVVDDIETKIFSITSEGKKDYTKPYTKDISDEGLQKVVTLLDDIIYFRTKEFDASTLIENLFEKLSVEKRSSFLKHLNDMYDEG